MGLGLRIYLLQGECLISVFWLYIERQLGWSLQSIPSRDYGRSSCLSALSGSFCDSLDRHSCGLCGSLDLTQSYEDVKKQELPCGALMLDVSAYST